MTRSPLVIVGPTASGKSSLAVSLARRRIAADEPTEVISADAMAVYAGMDIGTAKPTTEEQMGVPHHLIDVVDPVDDYTVSRFAEDVEVALSDLERRGVTAILVGGTGLYVRAVVDQFTIPGQYPEVVAELETELDSAVLHHRLAKIDPTAAAKMLPTNRRRIVRALEVCLGSGQPFSSFGPGVDRYPPSRFVQFGLEIDRELLDERIAARYRRQLADGFLEEVETLATSALSRTARQALGYAELLRHLDGELTLDEAVELAVKRTRRFARRQQRWFRRDPRIRWFEAVDPELVGRCESSWLAEPGH